MVNVAVRDFSCDQCCEATLGTSRLKPVQLTASAVCPGVCVLIVGAGLLAKAFVQSPLSSLANRIRQQAGSYRFRP